MKTPRAGNATRHNLHEMLMIALLCVIRGGRTCTGMALSGRSKEEFLRRFMRPEHGIPSHDAFSALFRIIDPGGLGRVLTRLAEDWSRRSGPDVTADAMHTLRPTAEQIIAGGGGCALALRGDRGALRDDVRYHMADPEYAEKMLCLKDAGRDHGRTGIREAVVCHDIDMLQDRHHWPGLQAVGKVTAVRESRGRQSTDTRYFLLSEKLDPERFLKTVRSHWAVENSLHWVLDVTMGEDSLRNRKDNGPENPALMRKPALNPARVTPTAKKESMRGRLMKAGWDNDFLLKLISSASNPAKDAKPGKIQTRQPW
ncbi:MAG: ISAs1 family transposase [Rhodobacteraceae bacterium]|nr:ISAs1 family transposase [Paracoccaceae bacterium]